MSKRKLTSKTKILIAALTLSVFVIAGIVSLVLVLAASQQNVTSNITVTYVSNNVSAEVTGKYWYTGSSKTTMGTTAFNAGDASETRNMSPSGEIELSTESPRVVFEYAFKNLSNDSAFTIELTGSPKITADGAQTADYNNMTEQYYVSAVEVPVSTLSVMEFSNTLNIQPVMKQRAGENDTVYIYVVASIANLANDAAYNGQFVWQLDYVAPANIETIALDNNGGSTAPATMEVVVPTAEQTLAGDVINMSCLFVRPTKENKGFAGYYDAATEGTKYISFNGSPTHANDFDFSSDVTLHAQWSDMNINPQGVMVGYSGNDTTLDVPEEVTALGANVFQNNTNLQEINLPTTLTEVGDNAFDGCTNLTEVNFDAVGSNRNLAYTGESSLTRVGAYAFKDCTSLTSIEIPGTATLSANMFSGCTNLKDITAPIYAAVNPPLGGPPSSNGILNGVTGVNLVINGNGTEIPNYAFFGHDYVAIPKNTLSSITIPSSVTSIGESAFRDCTGLTSITIPSSVTSIGSAAFSSCTSLTSVSIGSSVTSIGNNAFEDCTSLTSVSIPSSVTSIGNTAFLNCSSLTSVSIPSSVTSIGNGAFNGCTSLTSVSIPSSVTIIENSAFYRCTSLTSVSIPSSVTSIGDGAFSGCSSLTSVSIPSSVTSIGGNAFYGCTNLISVSIPSSVTSIGDSAFYGCTSLATVTIDSETIAGLNPLSSELLANATTVYVKDTISSVGPYITYSFILQGTSDVAGYNMYVKNS